MVISSQLDLSIEDQNIWATEPLNYKEFIGHEWDNSEVVGGSFDTKILKVETDLHIDTHGRAGLEVEATTRTPTLDLGFTGNLQTTITKIDTAPVGDKIHFGRNHSAFKIETSVDDTKINGTVNQLQWDFNAHAIIEAQASVTGSSDLEVKLEVPHFEVNPLSRVPDVVKPFLGHLADSVSVGPVTIIDRQYHTNINEALFDLNEDIELASLTNEELKILNVVDFRFDELDEHENYVLLTTSFPENKKGEFPIQVQVGNEEELPPLFRPIQNRHCWCLPWGRQTF